MQKNALKLKIVDEKNITCEIQEDKCIITVCCDICNNNSKNKRETKIVANKEQLMNKKLNIYKVQVYDVKMFPCEHTGYIESLLIAKNIK